VIVNESKVDIEMCRSLTLKTDTWQLC